MANYLKNLGVFLCAIMLVGCAGIRPRYHLAGPGEDWASLSSRYQIPKHLLIQYNRELAGSPLRSGSKIYLPYEAVSERVTASIDNAYPLIGSSNSFQASALKPSFTWPLFAPVSSKFGTRKRKLHAGIDIPAKRGTPVRAARAGHVIYASNKIRGYGKMVIIRHADEYATVYAHLDSTAARTGQFVARGQVLGKVGRTGHATGPHLHFEIRRKSQPVDPLKYLQASFARNTLRR